MTTISNVVRKQPEEVSVQRGMNAQGEAMTMGIREAMSGREFRWYCHYDYYSVRLIILLTARDRYVRRLS